MDRKRRDLTSLTTDTDEGEKTESEESKTIEARQDDVAELLEGSENIDDVQRRTRQLRPSIISSPWRVSSGASYRAIDFAPSHQNSYGSSSLSNFPTATSGLLYKSDGRFYPNSNFKPSGDFSPVISTYGGGSKNKFNHQPYNSYSGESGERSQEATPKYKQSSKIPGHPSSLFPLLFSLDSFEPKSKPTTSQPSHPHDNYSYFHIGKPKPDSTKTFAFPVTNQPTTTQRSPFGSFNSVGGFFNNNNQQSSHFLPLKPISKATPAPIYEGAKSASSYDSRYTTASPIKALPSTPYQNNPFLNNLAFANQSPSVFNFGIGDKKKEPEKVVQITTKKPSYGQYPIPSSTPKYVQAYTTPNQLFDFDKFVAGIRETQRLQSGGKFAGINNVAAQTKNLTQSKSQNRYQQIYTTTTTTTSTTASPDEYYYEDDEEAPTVEENLTKIKSQSAKPSINSFNRKPPITSNAASNEDDFYYDDDDDDDEDEEEFRPPPINKPKYTPMTETMAPRPMNVTTVRPYYVSGHTFSTPSPPVSTTSIIPSIIKFPDDVFQGIRPFVSPAPNSINKFNVKPNKNYEITKSTTTSTTERASTKRTKAKYATKPTTNVQQATSSTTAKPTRLTTRRKTYTIRPNRGNLKFKVSTKRPDLTRLEIDEKLPNR